MCEFSGVEGSHLLRYARQAQCLQENPLDHGTRDVYRQRSLNNAGLGKGCLCIVGDNQQIMGELGQLVSDLDRSQGGENLGM